MKVLLERVVIKTIIIEIKITKLLVITNNHNDNYSNNDS